MRKKPTDLPAEHKSRETRMSDARLELFTHRLFEIHLERGVIVYRRFKTREETTGEISNAWRGLAPIIAPHIGGSLILDIREAIGRNDDAFESEAMKMDDTIRQFFERIVFLTGTETGVLQVQRLLKERDNVLVTTDPQEAFKMALA